jgi:bacteriocin-like protein
MLDEKKKNEAAELTDDELEQVDGGMNAFINHSQTWNKIKGSVDTAIRLSEIEEEEGFQSSKKSKTK